MVMFSKCVENVGIASAFFWKQIASWPCSRELRSTDRSKSVIIIIVIIIFIIIIIIITFTP